MKYMLQKQTPNQQICPDLSIPVLHLVMILFVTIHMAARLTLFSYSCPFSM